MKKAIGFISLLLSITLAMANPIDFDKAFKESAKIENKSREPLSQIALISSQTLVQNQILRTILATKQLTKPL